MKRPAPESRSGSKTGDILKDFTEEQLRKIGAVALAWNEIEFALDCCLYSGLKLSGDSWSSVLSRIGVNDKLELLKEVTPTQPVPNNLPDLISQTSKSATNLKDLRNNVVHCRIFDTNNSIGENIRKGGRISQILLSEESLSWLYERLITLREEMTCINALIDLNKNARSQLVREGLGSDELVKSFTDRLTTAISKQHELEGNTQKFYTQPQAPTSSNETFANSPNPQTPHPTHPSPAPNDNSVS
jgi:hypothetical protein